MFGSDNLVTMHKTAQSNLNPQKLSDNICNLNKAKVKVNTVTV